MTRRRLPIGLQTFRELREEDCYYVDKTRFIAGLLDKGKHYFLSRPRRFGKSLLLDTLKELFEGNERLFAGLHIHDCWEWSRRHPVVRLDFGAGEFGEPGYVHTSAMAQLAAAGRDAGIAVEHHTAPERFRDLLRALHARTGQRVVVLVDEYDKPILDALDAPDVARVNRDYLRGLYSTIKSCTHVRFTFLTGVEGCARGNPSQETTVSLFSGLDNLKDITLDPRYSAICGSKPTRHRFRYRSCRVWTASERLVQRLQLAGARRGCTTRSTSCSCSTTASSAAIGSRAPRRRSSWRRCSSAGSVRCHWTGC